MLEIKHKDNGKKGEFFVGEDNQHLAEMAYTWAGESILIILMFLMNYVDKVLGVNYLIKWLKWHVVKM